MNSSLVAQPIKPTSSIKKIARLLRMGNEMTELVEEILEEQGAYKPEFLRGLGRSLADAKAGRVRTVESLAELMD